MAAVDYEKLARFYDGLVTNDDDVGFFVNLSNNIGATIGGRHLQPGCQRARFLYRVSIF